MKREGATLRLQVLPGLCEDLARDALKLGAPEGGMWGEDPLVAGNKVV